uniref:Si:ch211-106f21.1 n=1 Tax=Scleropages formosus TaxID=113540 RepID=A0A8C9R3B2_SCLFO
CVFEIQDSCNTLNPAPTAPLPPDAHTPLPTIIVVFCLFVLFASCTAFLAICRPSAEAGLPDGGCGSAEALPCSPSLSSEPELKLWKRLGSVRRSLTSSFRRPPQRRPDRRASAPTPTPPHLSVPCLYDHATEI